MKIARVVLAAARACEPPLADAIIEKSFQKWWPDRSEQLAAIEDTRTDAAPPPARSDRELLEEALNSIRTPTLRDFSDLDDFIADVILAEVSSFGTKRSRDLITIFAPIEVPRRAQRLIASRANADGLRSGLSLVRERRGWRERRRRARGHGGCRTPLSAPRAPGDGPSRPPRVP